MATVTPLMTDAGLFRLMSWLSPNFPVGAFAFSHGLEAAVDKGDIADAEDLRRWIEGILRFGAGSVDASLMRCGWEAVRDNDDRLLSWAAERGDALRGTSETALESHAQGQAFLDTLLRVWPHRRLARWRDELHRSRRRPPYAVAVGVAAAVAEVPLKPALVAFLQAFSANLVSAGVRLVPLGQTDGQRVLAGLEDMVLATVLVTLRRAHADLGGAALGVDWMSMQHETQYTRLFRS